MKILLLSDSNSIHTIKWAKSLANNNIKIVIFGLGNCNQDTYQNNPNIQVITLNQSVIGDEGNISKLKYLKALPSVKKIIQNLKPDIVHSHYATSYGLLGALCNFHPFILSVWGSDVFSFPNKSFLHRKVLEFNLKKADKILSTSHVMAKETQKYTNNPIEVTPFGIDLDIFKHKKVDSLFNNGDIVIGTVKTLEEKYGIEYLIRAFKIISEKYQNLPLKLLIVGGGSLETSLKQLTQDLKIENKTIFTGKVSHTEIPKFQNMLSVSVSVSDSESFGVAIIEASACEKPVVVSRIGGLPEVVEDGVTGLIVSPRNPEETANAIEQLIINKELRDSFGKAGRAKVKKLYNWNNNVKQMIEIYQEVLR